MLEGLGWGLHRIWSTDWFNDPRREIEKLRAIIGSRLEELKQKESDYEATASASTPELGAKTDAENDAAQLEFQELPLLGPNGAQLELQELPLPGPSGKLRQEAIASSANDTIAVGDTVRVRYTDDQTTLQFTISREASDLARGVVEHNSPIAAAVIDAEIGDEVEVLAGSYVRRAIVEKIMKNSMSPS